ncbi:MAG: GtrA family protein [Patescibacteria group bacterium]|jgi:putative flippase GtrA|nr:GtrA family protein [Patescibacteria group bacterium]
MRRILLFYIEKNKKIFRFVVAGGSATAVDIFLLFFLTEIIGLWYIHSAVLAFAASFFVSFYLQKYWTFEDNRENMKTKQMLMHFMVASTNLTLNTFGIFYLVHFMHIYYLLAQLMVVGFLGVGSFLMYNIVIFKKTLIESKILVDENNDR